jgi:hypothetical protein
MDNVRKTILEGKRPVHEKIRILSLLARDEEFRLSAATELNVSASKFERFIDEQLRRTKPSMRPEPGSIDEESVDVEAVIAAADAFVLTKVEELVDPKRLAARAEKLIDEAVESYVFAAFGLKKLTGHDGSYKVELSSSGSRIDAALKAVIESQIKSIAERTVTAAVAKAVDALEADSGVEERVKNAVDTLYAKEIEKHGKKIADERVKTRVERAAARLREGYAEGM